MKRIVFKDYFLTASTECKIIPSVPSVPKKPGNIIYPDGTNLFDDVIYPLLKDKNEATPEDNNYILINTGEALLTSDSDFLIFT